MATTIPMLFTGKPTISPEKIDILKSWYEQALGDMDKSTEPEDVSYYWGGSDYMFSVLDLLYLEGKEVVQKSNGNFKRAVLITGAVTVGYLFFKNKTKVQIFVDHGKSIVKDNVQQMNESFKTNDKNGFDRLKTDD